MDISIDNLKEDMMYWAKRLYQKDMMPYTSGNISVRYNNSMLISTSGVGLNDMEKDDIVLADFDGNLKEGTKKPSSEKLIHGEIYTLRDDINAIIHSHCSLLTAFAVCNLPIKKPILPDFAYNFDDVPIIDYYCPSSVLLADKASEMFNKYNAVLMKNHGIILGDVSLKQAFYKLELLKTYAETYFAAEVLGGANSLTKSQVLEIKKLVRRI